MKRPARVLAELQPLILVAAILACWAPTATAAEDDKKPPEPTQFAADRHADCLHIKLDLKVDVPGKHVEGQARLDLQALRELKSLTLNAVNLETSNVSMSTGDAQPQPVNHLNDGEHIEVLPDQPIKSGERFSLFIDYAVDNPESGLHFFAPTEHEPDVPYLVWSQGEAIYNRHWVPCFDNPNERQTTELIVTTDRKYNVSSNGRLVSMQADRHAGTATYHYIQDKPHVAYLISMIVGEFHIERETWRGKPVEYWVHPSYKDQVTRSFQKTVPMLEFFSAKIGVAYPWDRYAQICCEGYGGGMENTAATTLGNRALHDERSSLDSDSNGLIAHELAHQWFGDLLTCRDWAHIWLNEGFASYFEALWDEHDNGADEFAYNMYRKAASARRGGKDRPIVDRTYDNPRAMFDSRAYPKGAWVLHMIRRRLGDDLFWKVINHYTENFAMQTVETVDLRKTIEQVTGRSFGRFFYDWTERPGHPEVAVSFKWLSDEQLARIEVKQKQKAATFHFPLEIEFRFDKDREPIVVAPEITDKEMTFYYPLSEPPSLVRVDPNQAVLMELTENKGQDLWKAQLERDSSAVLRIRAAKQLSERKRDGNRRLLAEALKTESFWAVKREIARALSEMGGEIARDALIAGLQFKDHKARRSCAESLEKFHRDPVVIDAVRPLVVNGDPSYYVEAAAVKTYSRLEAPDATELLKEVLTRDSRFEVIRNAALSGLGRLRDAEVVDILCAWSRPDKPRRCRSSAIRALASLTENIYVDDDTWPKIVDALSAALDDTGRRVRGAAAYAIASLSEPDRARQTLSTLEVLAASDSEYRVRRAAERAVKAIKKGEPAQIQVAELREDLREALEQNDKLSDRIERLEQRLKAASQEEVAKANTDEAAEKESVGAAHDTSPQATGSR